MGKGFLRNSLSIIAFVLVLGMYPAGRADSATRPRQSHPAQVEAESLELVPGSAAVHRSAPAPAVRLDDLFAPGRWRVGDFALPSGAPAPGTAESTGTPLDCIAPDDDRCETWASTAGEDGNDLAWAAEMSPDGRHMFVAGGSYNTNDSDVQIASFDPSTGALQWITERDGGSGVIDHAFNVTVSPDSTTVFIVGAANVTHLGGDILIIAFDAATGAELWQRVADPSGTADWASAASVSPDGSTVVVAGYANNDPIALAYDTATGNLLWTYTEAGPEGERAVDVAMDAEAAYLVADDHNGRDYDSVVYALDLDDGDVRWTARFDGGGHDVPTRVAVDEEEGKVYLLSTAIKTDIILGAQGAEYGFGAYDIDTGAELWRARFAGARAGGFTIATSLVVVPDNDPEHDRSVVIASGLMDNRGAPETGRDYDFGTVAYDGATGDERWRAVYGNDDIPVVGTIDGTGRDQRPWDMAVSPDRATVYVTGRDGPKYTGGSSHGSSVDIATLAYDVATGEREWTARYRGSSATETGGDPEGVGVTPDGRWVVTGGTMNYSLPRAEDDPRDFVAVGYDEPTPSATPSPTPTESASPTPTESASPSPSESPEPELTDVSFTERSAESGQYSDETLLEARLTDSNGDPISAKDLTFELTGAESPRTFSAITDEDGVASVTPTLTEEPGPHQLTVRFAGDDDHAGDAETTSFVVEKEDTALELSVHGEDDDKTLRARLSDLDTASEGVPERTIDFYSDGELIGSGVTGPEGIASLPVPPGHRGNNRTYEAVFEGDEFYLGASDDGPGKGKGGNGNGGGDGSRGAEATYAGKMLLM